MNIEIYLQVHSDYQKVGMNQNPYHPDNQSENHEIYNNYWASIIREVTQ